MLYPDTVEAEVLVHKPWFVATMFGVVFAIFLVHAELVQKAAHRVAHALAERELRHFLA